MISESLRHGMCSAISQLIQYFACPYIRIISYKCLNANTCEVERTLWLFSSIFAMVWLKMMGGSNWSNFTSQELSHLLFDRKLSNEQNPSDLVSIEISATELIIISLWIIWDYSKYVCMHAWCLYVYIYIYVNINICILEWCVLNTAQSVPGTALSRPWWCEIAQEFVPPDKYHRRWILGW